MAYWVGGDSSVIQTDSLEGMDSERHLHRHDTVRDLHGNRSGVSGAQSVREHVHGRTESWLPRLPPHPAALRARRLFDVAGNQLPGTAGFGKDCRSVGGDDRRIRVDERSIKIVHGGTRQKQLSMCWASTIPPRPAPASPGTPIRFREKLPPVRIFPSLRPASNFNTTVEAPSCFSTDSV